MRKERLIIFLSLLSCLILDRLSYYPYDVYTHNLAIFSSFFVFLTLFELFIQQRLLNIYITIFIGMNWVFFQSPFLLKEKTKYFPRIIDESYLPEIALYMSISIVMVYIGYFFFLNKVQAITSREFRFKNATLQKLVVFFIILSVLNRIGTALFPSLFGTLSNLIQILFYSPTIAFALYGLYLIRTKSKPTLNFFHLAVILVLLLELLSRVATTMFVSTSLFFSGVLLIYFYEKRRLPLVYFVVLSFFLVPFYQARKYFRVVNSSTSITGQKQNSNSQFEQGKELLSNVYSSEGRQRIEKFKEIVDEREEYKKNRFENLSFISQVVYLHKNGFKEFLYGETFYWLPLAPVPRFIWAGKPENTMATDFATEYGVRGEDSNAAINFPMLVEAYVNFGFNGIIFMAFVFGLLFKWFVMKFGVGFGDINMIIIINCIKQFIHAEGNITLVFGAFLQVYLFWFVLLKVIGIDKNLKEA